MIVFSNGHRFEYMASSGAFAFNGRGWPWHCPLRWLRLLDPSHFTIVLKSLTRCPRIGNMSSPYWVDPFRAIRILDGEGNDISFKPWTWAKKARGVVNAVGLTNMGIEAWCRKIGPSIEWKKYKLIASIYSEDSTELAAMAWTLNEFPFMALEINASCPNTSQNLKENYKEVLEGVMKVYQVTRFPIILKLSYIQDYERIARESQNFIEAISVNSVPWDVVFPHKESPLARFGGGGVSGKISHAYTWRMVNRIWSLTGMKVIGPVWEFEDLRSVRLYGAKAVSFGSLHIPFPWRPTQYVEHDMKERRKTVL